MNSTIARYQNVRDLTIALAEPLSAEDCAIQSMPDASPVRWHLAHTTWFFETFLLKACPGYKPFHPAFESLFNSYYNSVGEQFPRHKRGLISRPGLEETIRYRRHVDAALQEHFGIQPPDEKSARIIEIGVQHEQQHQELILTDIKHALSINPLRPAYRETDQQQAIEPAKIDPFEWVRFDGGLVPVGHDAAGFCFDNELPRHQFFLLPFELSSQCVTNQEYRQFIDDGGYDRPEFWLSAGWAAKQEHNWCAPLYWERNGDNWTMFTLNGIKEIVPSGPVSHISYFEADAYARWAGYRLPTEMEWESAINDCSSIPADGEGVIAGHWSDSTIKGHGTLGPQQVKADHHVSDLVNAFGNLWEWTSSQYSAYPGYRAAEGALGEYNGKFMCNQFVLKGGSCATPAGHIRSTYRNFFPPDARWQFSGLRLAK